MFKPSTNTLVIMTMLFAFIGQAFAYSSMACLMVNNSLPSGTSMFVSSTSTMNHGEVDHAQMGHKTPAKAKSHSSMSDDMIHNMGHGTDHSSQSLKSKADDCCDHDCNCPENVCTNVLVITSYNAPTSVVNSTAAIVNRLFNIKASYQKSLFKPPIFA